VDGGPCRYNHLVQAGTTFGAYELVEQLGAGGMGVVWRARDRRLGRDVALKLLPSQLAAQDGSLARFGREARGLAALSHPNIVSIFDLGEAHSVPYIVTELLEGETLRDRIRRGALPWRKAAEICATIADGLAAAHAKGIVHRDLKPENVFITADERVKILDFGIAKALALGASEGETTALQTGPGVFLGTLAYMSPEQLRGEEAAFSTDIFSLGCLLYEMLTGRPAFLRRSSAETIAAIISADPARAGATTGAPPELLRIIDRCLAKEPGDRFHSARDLSIALRDLATGAWSRTPAAGEPATRSKLPLVSLAVVAIALVAILFVSLRVDRGTADGAVRRMSVAVVPFTAEEDDAYAGEGLADSIFRRLAPLRPLHVVTRKSLPGAPGEIDAGHLVRGSIARRGDELVVAAEIVDVRSGRRLWDGRYEAPAGDLLSVETRLSADIEAFFRKHARLGPTGRVSSTTAEAEAYREYLKGRHYWNKFTPEAFARALEHYQRAIDLDPTWALPYAGLADTYTLTGFHGGDPSEAFSKGRAAARRAIELDPDLGEAHTSLGTVLYLHGWQWAEAGSALRRGVELNPRYPSAHHSYAVYLGLLGRWDEALREITIAHELDPLSLVIDIDLAWIHFGRRDDTLALQVIERAVRHDGTSPLARVELAWYLDHLGRYEEAIDAMEKGLELAGGDTSPMDRLRAALRSGGETAYLRERLALTRAAGLPHATSAAILLRLGELEEAVAELENSYAKRETDLIYINSSRTYAAAKSHPRFGALVEKVGFPQYRHSAPGGQ
jgi:eukaryotic-like serine/threonine-protein kinase